MISSIAGVAWESGSTDMRAVCRSGVRNARMITSASLVYQPFQPTPAGLTCDGVSVESIVERSATPLYIYSATAITNAYRAIDDAFAGYPHAIHYALKANSTMA